MKRKLLRILVAALIFCGCLAIAPCFVGCTPTANIPTSGSGDPVVDAEKTTSIAVETINTFLKLEYDNQTLVKSKLPVVHAYSTYVRAHAPQWIATARSMTNAYKSNRNAQNQANLNTALAVLTDAITQINQYTGQITSATP